MIKKPKTKMKKSRKKKDPFRKPKKRFRKSEYKRKKPIRKLKLQTGKPQRYVLDTSAIIKKIPSKLIMKGIRGTIIIHNAVVAELEHLANLGDEAGFDGLEELGKLQGLKRKYKFYISFQGRRPSPAQIRYAKFGEIDALVRELAYKNKAVLITADYVQAKSALAYGIRVRFIPTKKAKPVPKKRFFRFASK